MNNFELFTTLANDQVGINDEGPAMVLDHSSHKKEQFYCGYKKELKVRCNANAVLEWEEVANAIVKEMKNFQVVYVHSNGFAIRSML